MTSSTAKSRRMLPLKTPTGLSSQATSEIAIALNTLLADMYTLFFKTKNFHWHVSGPHFREYHLLLDEHADQILATTDDIAERVRRTGGTTLRSVTQVSQLKRLADNEADFVTAQDMLAELKEDNMRLAVYLRGTHALCDQHGDLATASLIENWIAEAENRIWFLFESGRST
jgi:starvation-inducible DNA-binding protein